MRSRYGPHRVHHADQRCGARKHRKFIAGNSSIQSHRQHQEESANEFANHVRLIEGFLPSGDDSPGEDRLHHPGCSTGGQLRGHESRDAPNARGARSEAQNHCRVEHASVSHSASPSHHHQANCKGRVVGCLTPLRCCQQNHQGQHEGVQKLQHHNPPVGSRNYNLLRGVQANGAVCGNRAPKNLSQHEHRCFQPRLGPGPCHTDGNAHRRVEMRPGN
mmetsp:Transcript_9917/g.23624  ORF Transcript_9917/g.23624 Transcript_9917/m.23624 type:complete len:218 (-) Transcript_9917:289-942(-)